MNIQEQIILLIKGSLSATGAAEDIAQGLILELPGDRRFGDFTTNIAMRLSKSLKKAPRQVAATLIEDMLVKLPDSGLKGIVREIKVEGAGFINFYLDNKYFYTRLSDILSRGQDALKIGAGKNKKVLIEFVSANPTGSLSVAHARQAAVGDSLANILSFAGFNVQKEYYLNDEGNQINILGRSTQLRLKELKGEKVDFPEDHYQGDYIYDLAKAAEAKNIPQEQIGEFASGVILEIIKKELVDFGVDFDCWYSQKELAKSGKIEEAFAFLEKQGFLYKSEGALWFKSTAFGDDKDRVVIKSDGSQTYLAPDIAYHQDKFNRGFDWLINLWGPDHHGYIKRIKASIEAFGHKPESLTVVIVQLATIFRSGVLVQMSTRRGEYITLREVLDEVGPDAARFFFLMRRCSSHLDFDLEVAKKQSAENPVYYVQYAHARICSILRSSASADAKDIRFDLLKEKEELDLIKELVSFQEVINTCLATCDPYMLTVYLQVLAEGFHKFYDLHRVLGQDKEVTCARLGLINGVRIVLSTGLELLGVSRPEKM
jgi:arginyl-tRNA synthetase